MENGGELEAKKAVKVLN